MEDSICLHGGKNGCTLKDILDVDRGEVFIYLFTRRKERVHVEGHPGCGSGRGIYLSVYMEERTGAR